MSSDRIKAGLAKFVEAMLHRIDYLALYPAKVVAQNADGTLELQPDDTRLPGQSQVPIRLGIPGAAVKVTAGARVLLGFAGGRPEEPIATIWESGTVTEIVIGGAQVKLGSANAAQALALASKVKAELDAFITHYNAHTHTVSGATASACTAGGAVGTFAGNAAITAPPKAVSASTGSTMTKVDS